MLNFFFVKTIIHVGFSIIGCVDSTDILLKQPLCHLPAYANRKSATSVKLQVKGVCDSTLKFIDISCGWPGSMHDARIFSMSFIGRSLDEKLDDTVFHILGDSAYTLGVRLMKPYRDNGHLTCWNENTRIFNRGLQVTLYFSNTV